MMNRTKAITTRLIDWTAFNATAPVHLTWQTGLVMLWLLTMIAIPILRWVVGDNILHWGVTISVCLLAIATFSILQQRWGMQRALSIAGKVIFLAWTIEWIGHTTGYPFGSYDYTTVLQPQLNGVPLIIPLAWFMMLPASWAVGSTITGSDRGIKFALVSASAFTAWDLFLDPQMVSWGYWVWAEPGGYFGIPWGNYVGWLLSATLITLLVRPPRLFAWPLIVIYATTWLLQSIGLAFFWGMIGPAIVGFCGMGFFLYAVYHARSTLQVPSGMVNGKR